MVGAEEEGRREREKKARNWTKDQDEGRESGEEGGEGEDPQKAKTVYRDSKPSKSEIIIFFYLIDIFERG